MQLELRRPGCPRHSGSGQSGAGGHAAFEGVPASPLRAASRRIEQVTGGELFVRSRSGVAPTPLGEFVLSAARRVLGEMDALTAGTRAAAPHPTLRLGCILLVLVDRLFAYLEEELPGHEVDITTEHSATTLTRMLGAGKVRRDPVRRGRATTKCRSPTAWLPAPLIPKEPACLRLSATHPLAVQEEIELADLAGETWTALTDDDGRRPEAMDQDVSAPGRLHAETALPDRRPQDALGN
ncbi:hypothetical protein LT493_23390 [Streptomyces tricolor]|nr:hypothetical protein [Streptomyces tricolor]